MDSALKLCHFGLQICLTGTGKVECALKVFEKEHLCPKHLPKKIRIFPEMTH